jgi:hypothetical protein
MLTVLRLSTKGHISKMITKMIITTCQKFKTSNVNLCLPISKMIRLLRLIKCSNS